MAMIRIVGSMGDELGVTAAVRELKRQRPDEMIRMNGGLFNPEIWRNCPYTNIGNADDGRLVELYSFKKQTPETANSRTGHYFKLLGLDLSKIVDEFPEFWWTAEELASPLMVDPVRRQNAPLPLEQVVPAEELARAIAVDPGAGWSSRVWPHDRYDELCLRLRARGHILIQVGSRGPRPLAGVHYDLVGRLGLRAVARFLGRCRLFVGNDSGYQHVSAAVGLGHVTVYSVTRYGAGPYSTTVPVVPPTECAPGCFQLCQRVQKGCKHVMPCIEEIMVDQVEAAVDLALARPRPRSRLVPAPTKAEVHRLFRGELQPT